MTTSADEKAEIDALIAQLSPSKIDSNVNEQKRVYIRQNSGSNTNNVQQSGSPTDAHKHLLQKNAKIYKKNDRKSRQGKGRGCPKKGGAGGNFTWGSFGCELLDEYNEDIDEEDADDYEYNQAKEKHLAAKAAAAAAAVVVEKGEQQVKTFDKDIKPIIDEYFVNGDGNDVVQNLRKFNLRTYADGELLAYIMTLALEKSNVHKELISRLLHDLNGKCFRSNDYINAYDILLTTLNDLSLDNPQCSSDIGKFLARSIADKCIDNQQGKFFARYKGNVRCEKMQAALDKAETLVSMGDFYFLNNIWGAQSSKTNLLFFLKSLNSHVLCVCVGGFRPVRELADKMNFMIHEYYDSGDSDEAIRSLKELNVPHFFHEFIYELIEFCFEKNTERFVINKKKSKQSNKFVCLSLSAHNN